MSGSPMSIKSVPIATRVRSFQNERDVLNQVGGDQIIHGNITQSVTTSTTCLQSLAFPEMNLRSNDVEKHASETCEWLLKHENFIAWLGDYCKLLWIKGNPGTGKSTLLKYALQKCKDRASPNKLVLASFFFNGRGAPIQKSPLGLFRSLLHQVLNQVPDLLSDLNKIFKTRCDTMGKPGEEWMWHVAELRNFLEEYILRASKEYSIQIYVDALDECGEKDARDLVKYFQRLISKLSPGQEALRICFSCRHYPIIDLKDGLSICVEDENHQDIRTYIQHELDREFEDKHKVQELKENIVSKASGVFQWVALVVPRILDLHREGRNMRIMLKTLQEIPQDLDRFYQETLESTVTEDRSQMVQLMQWICFAQRPLSLKELRFAMAVDADTPYSSLREFRESDYYTETSEEMEKRVKSLSRGLVEVKRHGRRRVAQFIHQSVRDYLVQEGLQRLDRSSTDNTIGRAHFRLSRYCIRYMTTEEVLLRTTTNRSDMEREFPFLRYAMINWIFHTTIVEVKKIPQHDLLGLFQCPSSQIFESWSHLYSIMRLDRIMDRYFLGSIPERLLHIASKHGLLSVVEAIITSQDKVNMDCNNWFGHTPLGRAAGKGHEAVVKLLLATNMVDPNYGKFDGRTPLWIAAGNGHAAVVKLLLATAKVDPDREDHLGQTPLWRAAEKGHEAVVKLLLATDKVDPDRKDGDGQTPLWKAAKNGHEVVVKLLLTTDKVDPERKGGYGRTPLWWAAEKGHEGLVKLLVATAKVDPDREDHFGQTPLWRAAEKGHKAVVKLLLATDKVDPDREDGDGQTPLWRAAKKGHKAVVKLLLATDKVDPERQGDDGQTPLWWAAQNGDETAVKLLLATNKVSPNCMDQFSRTPLWKAAQNGHEAVVKLLLATDKVDPDRQDQFGQTPLWGAAGNGHEAVVKLLLATNKVDLDRQCGNGRTPLWKAAVNGCTAVVKLLLATDKVDPDRRDQFGQTPLWGAAGNGHEAVVKLLLATNKVDLDRQYGDGRTPLWWAARNGCTAVVKLLLATDKVDPDRKDPDNRTPLSWAAGFGREGVVELLLATDKVDPNRQDGRGRTPLRRGAAAGHISVVKLLLATDKVDPDRQDGDGQTPLWRAAESGHTAVVKLLLATDKVDPDRQANDGQTPLWRAVAHGHEAVVKLLLATDKVDPNRQDGAGRTPLWWAARNGRKAMAKLLQ